MAVLPRGINTREKSVKPLFTRDDRARFYVDI